MVYDSCEWKKELREKKRQLLMYNKKENFERNFDKPYFRIERAIVFSAFIIRILAESEKLSDNADAYSISVSYYVPIKHIDRLHHWMDEDEYDWDQNNKKTILGKNVCNWIIHSYVFRLIFDESGIVTGFFVSSDYDRNKALYSIMLDDWNNYLNYIISDNIVSISFLFDEKKADYIAKRKKRV